MKTINKDIWNPEDETLKELLEKETANADIRFTCIVNSCNENTWLCKDAVYGTNSCSIF